MSNLTMLSLLHLDLRFLESLLFLATHLIGDAEGLVSRAPARAAVPGEVTPLLSGCMGLPDGEFGATLPPRREFAVVVKGSAGVPGLPGELPGEGGLRGEPTGLLLPPSPAGLELAPGEALRATAPREPEESVIGLVLMGPLEDKPAAGLFDWLENGFPDGEWEP